MNIGSVIRKVINESKKAITEGAKKLSIIQQRNDELYNLKKYALSNIPKKALVNIYLSYNSNSFSPYESTTKNIKNLPKYELEDRLAGILSIKQVSNLLVKVNKFRIKREFDEKVIEIRQKYNYKLASIKGKNTEQDELLIETTRNYMKMLSKYISKFVSIINDPGDESNFQKELMKHLKTIINNIHESISENVRLQREHYLTRRNKIDLLFVLDKIRIGVELKYNIEKNENEHKRLIGEVENYLPFLNGLFIVSYRDLRSSTIQKLGEISKRVGKPLFILTKKRRCFYGG